MTATWDERVRRARERAALAGERRRAAKKKATAALEAREGATNEKPGAAVARPLELTPEALEFVARCRAARELEEAFAKRPVQPIPGSWSKKRIARWEARQRAYEEKRKRKERKRGR